MREIRLSGSEGGGSGDRAPLPLSSWQVPLLMAGTGPAMAVKTWP